MPAAIAGHQGGPAACRPFITSGRCRRLFLSTVQLPGWGPTDIHFPGEGIQVAEFHWYQICSVALIPQGWAGLETMPSPVPRPGLAFRIFLSLPWIPEKTGTYEYVRSAARLRRENQKEVDSTVFHTWSELKVAECLLSSCRLWVWYIFKTCYLLDASQC